MPTREIAIAMVKDVARPSSKATKTARPPADTVGPGRPRAALAARAQGAATDFRNDITGGQGSSKAILQDHLCA